MIDNVQRIPAPSKSPDSPALNGRQLCFFAAFIVPLSKLLETPSLLAKYALGDLLLPALIQFVLQAIPLAAILFIASKTDKGLFSLVKEKLGKVGAKIVYWILAAYYLFSTLLPLLDLEKFVQAAFYDTAPTAFTFGPFFLLSGFICAKGLKSFGRIADICFPIFIVAFFGLIFMSAGEADYEAILPWFEFPASKIFDATRFTTAHFSDAILFLPLLGDYRYQKGDGKKVMGAFGAGAAVTILFLATFYGIFSTIAPSHHYAFAKIAQYFPALKTVGRLDLLLVYLLTVILLYYHTFPIQLCGFCVAKALDCEQKTLISVIINAGLFAFIFFCNKYYNVIYETISQTLWWIFPIFSIAIPLLCLLLLIGQKKKNSRQKTKNAESNRRPRGKKEAQRAR